MLPTTTTETHISISICTPKNAYPRLYDAILSTKYFDDESELAYYGYRYYSPEMGRWLSRDPVGEEGGVNLYCMVANNSVGRWDYLGLLSDTLTGPGISARKQESEVCECGTITISGRIDADPRRNRNIPDDDTGVSGTPARFVGVSAAFVARGNGVCCCDSIEWEQEVREPPGDWEDDDTATIPLPDDAAGNPGAIIVDYPGLPLPGRNTSFALEFRTKAYCVKEGRRTAFGDVIWSMNGSRPNMFSGTWTVSYEMSIVCYFSGY